MSLWYATHFHFEYDALIIEDDKEMQDEEHLPADVGENATGFDTVNQWVAKVCGENATKTVGGTWGLGLGK